jgi:hypothetical protein
VGLAPCAQARPGEPRTTPACAQRAHAICERFLLNVRGECLDHLLILHEKQLNRLLHASLLSFNQARPQHGIQQQTAEQQAGSVPPHYASGKVISLPVLGGLHRDESRSACVFSEWKI